MIQQEQCAPQRADVLQAMSFATQGVIDQNMRPHVIAANLRNLELGFFLGLPEHLIQELEYGAAASLGIWDTN